MRLNRFLASFGQTSRRKAEEFILQGQVKINGKKVTDLATKVNLSEDLVSLNGQYLYPDHFEKKYIAFHKPRACVTTHSDPEGRTTIYDYLPKLRERLFHVGRLDYHSEGLILITNDGEFCQKMTHPSHGVLKTYEVKVFGKISQSLASKIEKGIIDQNELLKPTSVKILKYLLNKTWLQIQLMEGKNREIRRLCEAFDLEIDRLKRTSIHKLHLGSLKPGDYAFLDKKQVEQLLN